MNQYAAVARAALVEPLMWASLTRPRLAWLAQANCTGPAPAAFGQPVALLDGSHAGTCDALLADRLARGLRLVARLARPSVAPPARG